MGGNGLICPDAGEEPFAHDPADNKKVYSHDNIISYCSICEKLIWKAKSDSSWTSDTSKLKIDEIKSVDPILNNLLQEQILLNLCRYSKIRF